MTEQFIGLDFETYGAVNLLDHGLERYVSDASFRPLIASTYWKQGGIPRHRNFDWVYDDFDAVTENLEAHLQGRIIVAHNAGFERRVLQRIGIDLPADRFVDSAVFARAMGAGGRLEAAAPQLLNVDKLEDGRRLIMLFSVPQKEQTSLDFDTWLPDQHPEEWSLFFTYCQIDAELSFKLAQLAFEQGILTDKERANCAVTMEMNQTGWHVDVATVQEMQRRYLENMEVALAEFTSLHGEVNLNSLKQMKEFCNVRGIKASSFDEKHVAKMLDRIRQKILGGGLSAEVMTNYSEVVSMLETKQILGGSSLKKLQVILDTVGHDGRLRDQYLHIGAGQSFRTSGRSVQMQNLKRLAQPRDMLELMDDESEWTNEDLALNLRQVFTASHPQGALIVGDFSSVESRGLAWLAGEQWKLDAFTNGQDVYKVGASKQFIVPYEQVTKDQRQFGKVGELSCGYQAGPGAVQMFAANMGVELSEVEASKLVSDWRSANPNIVTLWQQMDTALREVIEGGRIISNFQLRHGYIWELAKITTPTSLTKQHVNAETIAMRVYDRNGNVFLERVFHGCYMRGNSICYYKPSERKTGDLWSSHFVDPKTKQVKFYNIYGGKLAGITTQSFCREIFFDTLRSVHDYVKADQHLHLIGQFHDEIVLDWQPGGVRTLENAKAMLEHYMSNTSVPGFPLAAEIKHDYRYTK